MYQLKLKKRKIPLNTIVIQFETEADDRTLLKERTLQFESDEKPEKLIVDGVHYWKDYHLKIQIFID
ncbi:hypothetical protein [Cytobacillus purgationiresistens]|uniref:hypothetical protein n=1 Tax=Cytobacillus purgationiresistens TaxID=863449 RepID=UPI0027D7A129|nr:hypothetical protein [Cytobacillus purgationiresistens]